MKNSASNHINAVKQHLERAVETGGRFSDVMAIALDPNTDYCEGVIRCITSREGNVEVKGYIDRSELYKISKAPGGKFIIGEKVHIKKQGEIIGNLQEGGLDFIGLEDPDIWIDEETGLMHLYFTLPLLSKEEGATKIHLGHAVGKNLDSLEMTQPALLADIQGGAKEVSIAPKNSKGIRYNLVESADIQEDTYYSVVRIAEAENMEEPWKFGKIVFHPIEHDIPWIGGHASPGPLFSKSFIDVGEGKALGVMNGREANKKIGNEVTYGTFSVGLFIYNYEDGEIEWVSPVPFIQDTEAKTITFASQFIETTTGKGILYAHVDDSFVRGYDLEAREIKKWINKNM